MPIFKIHHYNRPVIDLWNLPYNGTINVHDFVEDRLNFARRHANWYRCKKRRIQFISKLLRLMAILLVIAGGIIPLLAHTNFPVPTQAGYILLALGGGCVLTDRIFGVSAGWVRYMIAAINIEAQAEIFRANIVEIEIKKNSEKEAIIIQKCNELTENIIQIVKLETEAWVQEFSNGRNELSRIAAIRRH